MAISGDRVNTAHGRVIGVMRAVTAVSPAQRELVRVECYSAATVERSEDSVHMLAQSFTPADARRPTHADAPCALLLSYRLVT